MENKTNAESVALLTDPEQKETAGVQAAWNRAEYEWVRLLKFRTRAK